MFGPQALPYVCYLARKADSTAPYAQLAVKVVPLVAPEYGEAAMQ